jgi:hypothetical protein
MKISVHIERLVLEGLPVSSAQGARLGAAVERELARLVAAGGLAGTGPGGAVARADAGTIRLRPRDNADAIGRKIALAAYRGIGGAGSGPGPGPRRRET